MTIGVVIARVLLLLGAFSLAVGGAVVMFRDPAGQVASAYACPMHPEVTSNGPAECPICKMELEPIQGSAPPPSKPPSPAPSSDHGGRHRYVCPMHPEVSSDKPGTCPKCKMELEPVTANPPEKASPAVVPAVARTPALGATWLPETFPPADQGTPSDRVAVGTVKRRVFNDGVKAPAWLESPHRVAALLYRDEVGGLARGQHATLYRSLAPRSAIEVELADDAPSAWDDSTSIVRFELRADAAYRAGDTGWVEIQSLSRELAVLPESALLRSDEGPYVLVAHAEHYVRRKVETGRTLRGNVVVLSGVSDSDAVVLGGAFFLDVEHRHAPAEEARHGRSP